MVRIYIDGRNVGNTFICFGLFCRGFGRGAGRPLCDVRDHDAVGALRPTKCVCVSLQVMAALAADAGMLAHFVPRLPC